MSTKPDYAIQHEAATPGFDYVANARAELDACLRRQPRNGSISSDTWMECQRRLIARGQWRPGTIYLQVEAMSRKEWIDCAEEEARMEIERATRASDRDLLITISYPTGGTPFYAAWAEAGKRRLV